MSTKKPSPPPTTLTATCNCAAIQLSVTGIDKGSVLCHCSNCRRASGSAFAYNHRFLPGELKFVKGEEAIRQYVDTNTKSGNPLERHFCGTCGCPMFMKNPQFKGLIVLHGGSLEDHRVQPRQELFIEDKRPWVGEVTSKKAKL